MSEKKSNTPLDSELSSVIDAQPLDIHQVMTNPFPFMNSQKKLEGQTIRALRKIMICSSCANEKTSGNSEGMNLTQMMIKLKTEDPELNQLHRLVKKSEEIIKEQKNSSCAEEDEQTFKEESCQKMPKQVSTSQPPELKDKVDDHASITSPDKPPSSPIKTQPAPPPEASSQEEAKNKKKPKIRVLKKRKTKNTR
ncbi:unnamed protein product [Moneuplotes crassus]|uniref:Uncharacterized protein n=1 Tax=Euplotes crassus TaxID=5936 RepID=A0AAD1XP74_EUPCR|nr:unnamed protein product [Moneuplotes crassus]